jgi:gamma-glutamyltranspeptidase/glutathione hydrolase
MMLRRADGSVTAIDYRETAPAGATRDMYLTPEGELIKGEGSSLIRLSRLRCSRTVAGMAFALKEHGSGKLTWSQLIEPARKLAAEGFVVTQRTQRSLEDNQEMFAAYADSRRIFLRDGKLFREGEILKQPELAATLARLQKNGPREFYEGETARLIAEDMKRNGGLITADDLRGYTPKGARAIARQVSRARDHLDAAAILRRRRLAADAEHPRRLRPEEARPALIRQLPSPHRIDAARVR